MTSRALLFLLLALAPSLAWAFVTCSFTSTPGMAFGVYDDSSAAADTSSTSIVARCSRFGGSSNASVVLQIGASATSGTIASRQMASGGNRMNYNLYRDAGYSQVWGQTIGTDTVTINLAGIPNGGSRNATFTIYGSIPALQNVSAGAYSDSVLLTVTP